MTIIGYAPGAFDTFHIGHLNLLKSAKQHCDFLVAGVVTDKVVYEAKNKLPVISFEERLEIVRSICYVDKVFVDDSTDKIKAWEEVRYNVLFKGDDWKGTERAEVLEAQLSQIGVDVMYFPYTNGISSSLLRKDLGIP